MALKILILCTGNSCRSQMAEGFLQQLDHRLCVRSAGTNPAPKINAHAVEVMYEDCVDLSGQKPKPVTQFLNEEWDYVITVCEKADQSCPHFKGKVKHRLRLGFDDPAAAQGTEDEVLNEFRRVRDEICVAFKKFYERELKPQLQQAAAEPCSTATTAALAAV